MYILHDVYVHYTLYMCNMSTSALGFYRMLTLQEMSYIVHYANAHSFCMHLHLENVMLKFIIATFNLHWLVFLFPFTLAKLMFCLSMYPC